MALLHKCIYTLMLCMCTAQVYWYILFLQHSQNYLLTSVRDFPDHCLDESITSKPRNFSVPGQHYYMPRKQYYCVNAFKDTCVGARYPSYLKIVSCLSFVSWSFTKHDFRLERKGWTAPVGELDPPELNWVITIPPADEQSILMTSYLRLNTK